MIPRRIGAVVQARLERGPAVALLGPRQVGKTTLALEIAGGRPSVYLDLESDADRSRLAEPALYLADHADELVVLDEIHRVPGLFDTLRGVIDAGRREWRGTGRFLLLGSAGIELMAQSGESLAGRVSYCELMPIDALEAGRGRADDLWLRGGFPESLLAGDDGWSLRWRRDFIRTYLERDVPQLGPRIPAEALRRLWTMLGHGQGGLFNASRLAGALGVTAKTIARYVDLLADLLLVRRLTPWTSNAGKRLVRAPKVYVRDSGLVHALLGIADREALLGHPVAGASWEGHVIESLLAAAGDTVEPTFYRSAAGAEIDLVLSWADGERWAVEIKRSLAPRLERGFHTAWDDVAPTRGLVVYPGDQRYPLREAIDVMPVADACSAVAGRA